MAAFLGDIDVTPFVDAQEIRNRIARCDGSEERAVAGAKNMDVGMGHEERSRAEDGKEYFFQGSKMPLLL